VAAMSKAPMQDRTTTRKLITICAAHAAGEFNRRHEEGEKETIRQQLFQAQKIESVGQLAGGIAHDVNNLLVVILGYVDIAADSFQNPKALENSLLQIRKASERAAELTRQLLSFSRRQLMELKPFDPNTLITNLGALLERLLPESISYQFIAGENISNIQRDAGQLEQALVNLAVNSRDAMLDGRKLIITTEHFTATESFTQTYSLDLDGRLCASHAQ
jgi:two-component system cell cycle sensor histidine kinase/response regulator CckA